MLLVTAEEMRELDRATIDSGAASAETLMERAGAGVVAAIERHFGSVLGLRVLTLAGAGNNGGDGFVAARHLRDRGAEVRLGLVADPARVSGAALAHLRRLESAGVETIRCDDETALRSLVASGDRWDFALDALLGTGARGSPEGPIADAVQALRDLDDAGTRIIAVDLPTGVQADSGEIARRAVRADLTVTFGEPKRGHYLYPGRAFAGEVEVVDIGLVAPPDRNDAFRVELATEAGMALLAPRRDPRAHKGAVGRVVVIGGSVGLTGAVALAAHAASRSGAGYVQAALPASLNDILEVKLTEEMTIPCAETESRSLAPSCFEALRDLSLRCDSVVLGSGLSRDPESAELARRLAKALPRPVVIDADALNALAPLAGPIGEGDSPRILTPHLGEMARLTGIEPEAIESRRIEAARDWARTWGVVVVLKGAPTVIASPSGAATVNPTGNPGMAAAGTGDVLAGVIAALVAQGLGAYDAARLGAYLHGRAGDLAARSLGQHGMTAGDLLDRLPHAMLALVGARDQATTRGSP